MAPEDLPEQEKFEVPDCPVCHRPGVGNNDQYGTRIQHPTQPNWFTCRSRDQLMPASSSA